MQFLSSPGAGFPRRADVPRVVDPASFHGLRLHKES